MVVVVSVVGVRWKVWNFGWEDNARKETVRKGIGEAHEGWMIRGEMR